MGIRIYKLVARSFSSPPPPAPPTKLKAQTRVWSFARQLYTLSGQNDALQNDFHCKMKTYEIEVNALK
jgi:hypothetical protein